MRATTATLLPLLLVTSTAVAQEAKLKTICWKQTDSSCRVIVLSEVGYGVNLARNQRAFEMEGSTLTDTQGGGPRNYAFWEYGALARVSSRWSVGGSWQFRSRTPEATSYTSLNARTRYWLKPDRGLDVAFGRREDGGQSGRGIGEGYRVAAGVSFDDVLVLRLAYDDLEWRDAHPLQYRYTEDVRRARSLQANAAVGGLAGGIATAATMIGVAMIFVILAGASF